MQRIITLLICMCIIQGVSKGQEELLVSLEKSMVKVGNKLYASKYETYNYEYNSFLEFLKENGRSEELEIAWPDTAAWSQAGEKFMPMANFYRWHPSYSQYPVVNVSYEAAVLYCNWLTEQYMSYPGRIFKTVKFRLPAETEWMNAARGGLKDIIYPWGTDKTVNDEGLALCNFWQFVDDKEDMPEFEPDSIEDFATSAAPVKSYFPNGFGLYNISGNVAEMTSRKGVSKGGGWKSSGTDVRIDIKGAYDGSSPYLGFRIFMDVLD